MPTPLLDLFDPRDREQLLSRLESWQEGDPAQWGKLDAHRAVLHCQEPLRIALGERAGRRSLIGFLFGGFARRMITAPKPTPRNLPTDPTFLPAPRGPFGVDRTRLVELARRFGEAGPGATPRSPHPFFGALSPAEWSLLMAKHLDHHLRQFGR